MKAFCRQKILKSNCLSEETVVIGILVTSRNGNRKTMQPIR